MDPLTLAAQEFVRQLAEAWRRSAHVRLVAPREHRAHVLRSLRVFEWERENRWPLCIVELPAGDVAALGEVVVKRVTADFAELRRAFAEDGVALAELFEGDGPDPWLRARALLDEAGEALARTGAVAGLALAVVTAPEVDRRTRGRIAELLREWGECAHVRVGLWCEADGELARVLPAAAKFVLDEAALHDFCYEQTERQIASAPPDEALVHRHLLVAAEAARRHDLPAAKQAYAAAGAALERQGKRAEAAVVEIALGGMSFGLGDVEAALGHFDRAAGCGAEAGQMSIVAQAHLGAAGCLFAGRAYAEAAVRYRAAAESGADVLSVEALRMAGVAHAKLGEREAAGLAWQGAVDRAAGMPARARAQTSWKQAGEALLELLQRRGLTAQYEHLHRVLNEDGGA